MTDRLTVAELKKRIKEIPAEDKKLSKQKPVVETYGVNMKPKHKDAVMKDINRQS